MPIIQLRAPIVPPSIPSVPLHIPTIHVGVPHTPLCSPSLTPAVPTIPLRTSLILFPRFIFTNSGHDIIIANTDIHISRPDFPTKLLSISPETREKTKKVAIMCEKGTFQLPFRTLSPLFCHFHPILGKLPTPSFSFGLSRGAEDLRQRKFGIIRADHINCGGDKREEVYLPDGCRYTSSINER